MTVTLDESFTRDARKIKDAAIKKKISKVVERLEQAKNLNEIPNLKKMKGFDIAYRIRIGEYRIGFLLLDKQTIELVRVLHRKDIYKQFP